MVGLLCRQVRQAERYNWAATRGVNEEMLLEILPEDLQTDIRRHLFKFIKKVSILVAGNNRLIACILVFDVIISFGQVFRVKRQEVKLTIIAKHS
jgi:hypothetical protein